ncbi:hypothetical protein KFL_000040560 [Klebsormidium nitens]|uniref:Uncharacterized protein n=1 Tax=Klebsormidium nitens TaxID=105231 RepID=A0A1Y1HMT3_KLENI|nr:hypothetical protein KFL_000040560 [Klebsormidium nitens]|eukprot:GAQ77857.1 hypothetical protein KFL_000040560 [Klebsormidium nitens]
MMFNDPASSDVVVILVSGDVQGSEQTPPERCIYGGDLQNGHDWVTRPGDWQVLTNIVSSLCRTLSSILESVENGSCAIEQTTLAELLKGWGMVFVALESLHQSLHKLGENKDESLTAEAVQRLLVSTKTLFASLDSAARDQCRFYWADASREVETKMPWSTFVYETMMDFSTTQNPVRLLECHLYLWRPTDPLPIDRFLKVAPNLTLELSGIWLKKFSHQYATKNVFSMRCVIEANILIFEAALYPQSPTPDDVRFQLLEVWFAEYVCLDRKKAVDPRLSEALKKIFLSLPVSAQAELVDEYWGKLYASGSRSSSFDTFFDDWYIRTA